MTKIDIPSFNVGDKAVVSVAIKPLSFVAFSGYMNDARAVKGVTADVALRRIRLVRQVTYSDAMGNAIPMDEAEVLRFPVAAARKILNKLDDIVGKPGSLIGNGDGISSVITYKLGTPIPVAGTDKTPIEEIEFLAKNYGDVEAMFIADDPITQTLAMLRTLAKPIHKTLTSMPDWAVNAISIADGVTMAQQVVPRFLEDSEENA
jgi:hypothetical protein